ncbi:PEP-utilizing enzyme [uncultured Desulfovibrio sp.]|uniref:PEP-utilizing enzyme n=1 Tax=uncultured Desulfovibrio sp. TaxID=167968 RepID=UPI002627A37C|nr:PEP-utilizing enzyme [uncultured Desulfovibrio sp.]
MFLSKFFKRITGRDKGSSGADASPEHTFAVRHHRFKLFLTAWNKFQENMTSLEYTLCCDHPFGLHRVQALCTSVATQVYQCIQHLERLNPSQCKALYERFGHLQTAVASEVYPRLQLLEGPYILSLEEAGDDAGSGLADRSTVRLGELRRRCPEVVPEGFVVTAAGCMSLFAGTEMLEEMDRRIQAAGGYVPETLQELSESLGELTESTPLPDRLVMEFCAALEQLRQKCPGRMRLLFKGRLWPCTDEGEQHSESDPGLLVWGPTVSLHAPDMEILAALHKTLARKQQAQALVYRRARGLMEANARLCITCLAVEEGSFGGTAHTANPIDLKGGNVHIYFCNGLPQDMEYSLVPVDVMHVSRTPPYKVSARCMHDAEDGSAFSDQAAAEVAALAMELERRSGCPQSMVWLRTPSGQTQVVMARAMVIKARTQEERDGEAESSADDNLPAPLLAGGVTTSRGRACGPVVVARSWADVLDFPDGGILVVQRDLYQWASLVDRAGAIIAEDGLLGSRLFSLAREFGIPAMFGLAGATEKLATGEKVTVCTEMGCVFSGQLDELMAQAHPPRDYLPGSPVYRVLQHAAEHILPLTIDVDSVDFKAANCQTYHDIARYCHEKAVSAMFTLGSDKQYAAQRIKQLRDQVLKQFWVVNLNDGFGKVQPGPVIDVEDITSVPLQAIWRGMNAYPWQGPPPVDGKGFLSVLFEATANPNLDPAAQTAYFTEKNYFMVSRDYCSLHSRFGFHFVSVEARLGDRTPENYVAFQLRGGAANIERRILRVRFVADLLWEFGLTPVVRNDAVTARLEGMDMEEGQCLLAVAGYLTIHTRQLDMIMQDSAKVAATRKTMLNHCRILLTGGDLSQQISAKEE